MSQSSNGKGTILQHARAIKNNSRNMGTYVLGGRGTGKSYDLALVIAWSDFLAHRPQVIFDPLGTTSRYFLNKLVRTLSYLPTSEHAKVWERVVYCDMSGRCGFTCGFPVYYRQDQETLQEMSERLLTVIELSNPGLVANVPLTWPATRRLGLHAGTILSALGFQPTELEDLLFNPLEWERTGRFQEALRRFPEDAEPAVSYFRNQYLPLSQSEKSRLRSPLLDHVFRLTSDRHLRAVFCAAPDAVINWSEVEALGQTVILDFSRIGNPATKRFALLWTFFSLYEFIKQRDRNSPPFGIIIDEFASLTQKVTSGTNPLATLLDEFIQQYMRNSNIWLTIAHQTILQLDDQLRNTVLSLGNYCFFQSPTMEAARLLADALYLRDPYWVKYWHPIFGRGFPRAPLEVIAERPEFMPLDQQTELFAQTIRKLPQWHFLLRPASEGEIGTKVYPISIRSVDLDPVTNEHHFPDSQLMERLYPILAAKSGIPITDILQEQEARLAQGITQKSPQTQPLPDDGQPEQQKLKTDPARLTLDEDHVELLTFLIDNPDSPVSVVYKKVGIRAARITTIRDELTAHGFLQELEVRTGSTTGGRPVKFLIPTMKAWERLAIDPPKGRGGAIHRYVQRMVVHGALAKGYSALVEHAVGTGIVDVHLQKGAAVKIGVEIAIASVPERETAHIKHHLSVGYDQVYGLFADDQLLERTATLLRETFSAQEQGRVRLLPLRMVSQVG